MPPFLPRKRLRTPTPEAGPSKPSPKPKGKGKSVTTTPRKTTLFDDLDAGTGAKRTAEQSKVLLEKLASGDDDESSLSSLSDDEFEDVSNAKREKTEEASDDEDEDIEFEDVQTHAAPVPSGPAPSGDLELTLRKDTRISLTNPLGTKKGPSKIERGIRIATHQMHVQMLMFHNAIRNAWLCDKEVQAILVKQLSPTVVLAVEKWRRDSGFLEQETPKAKGKGKGKATKSKIVDPRSQRDWGEPAARLESGQVNMSGGDPMFRLLRVLRIYWKQRFRITAPGLRKLGYMSLERLDEETKSFNKDAHNPELHGERIRNIDEFRQCAKALEGSRDVGAQLFTALLRGLGVEARMVASLQPVGFGWSQNEEASEKNPRKLKENKPLADDDEDSSEAGDGSEEEVKPKSAKSKGKAAVKAKKSAKTAKKPTKRSSRGSGLQDAPIDLSDSELSDIRSEEDDDSVIDVTPAKRHAQTSKPYDKDLLFPHYWTEVLSPITNTYTAVDPVVLNIIATNSEFLGKFEPRGAKADKAKQVTSYIIAHSLDGTAKDVTTRYLKRQMWPGRTKGNRIPVEKVPVYNSRGKIKRYEEYDWFKTVMSGYVRGTKKCPRTEIDDHEEATDLKPVKPEKKEVEEGKETLQSYKSSSEFVLERHLKREQALLPTAKHVKMFTVKGKGQETTEEKVYLRKDVVSCKTVETWHKEGRAPIEGEEPLKRVPYRAATTNRRRELAEAEQATGEKMLQGLYSWDQTDWIIPPPIENGVIPKNNFGNIDLYVDSMLPEGAAHIPKRGTVKICKRLGIDYAEAVTGFEFGHRMAVPIITGVVVAIENYEAVMEEWEKDEVERVRKEDEKRTKVAISMWRKMLMGMRIIERVREEYGDEVGDNPDVLNPWTNKKKGNEVHKDLEAQRRIMEQRDEDMAGGFLLEGHDEEEVEAHHSESFFPVTHEDDDEGGGFVVEGHDEPAKSPNGQAYPTPQSLQSNLKVDRIPESEEEDAMDVDYNGAQTAKKPSRSSNAATKSTNPTKSTSASTKAKTLAKRPSTQRRTPASSSTGKRKRQIADSELEDEESSSLSDLESEDSASEIEEAPKKTVNRGRGRRATMPAMTTESPRKIPKRKTARKSAMALKSHYFEHSDDGDE
jgi:xeroderma pigmentosum group C-complementing protein